LDKLITDRPENCRRKAVEPVITRLPNCPASAQMQPQPIVTLALQCLPMHHHHQHHQHHQHHHQQHHHHQQQQQQLHAQLQAQARLAPMSPMSPMSPAPAQTPPLHAVPDLAQSPLAQPASKQPHGDFYSLQGDTEVDALDPSIMDFALQGTDLC